MREINIDFEEKYKETDNYIKDAWSTEQGVSSYITMMENTPASKRKDIASWDADLKQLKHLRWIRNQLAHEVSIDSDICQAEDYAWLYRFCNRLYDGTDPLGKLMKAEKNRRTKTAGARHTDSVKSGKHSAKGKRASDAKAFVIGFIVIAAIVGLIVLIAELI